MLTWKIFVITMSVATLTLVNVNSSGSASSSGRHRDAETSRPRRARRLSNINADYLTIFSPDVQRPYLWEYNTYNKFNPETFEYKCYKQIRLFCENQYNDLQSKHCVKRAFHCYTDGVKVDLLDAVYNFYANFPINAGNFKLPIEFCEYEAGIWIGERPDIQELLQNPDEMYRLQNDYAAECEESLTDYKARVHESRYVNQQCIDEALYRSRNAIARFALLNKSVLEIGPGFESKYLNSIADRVTAIDNDHNPYDYCRNPENNPNRQTELRLG